MIQSKEFFAARDMLCEERGITHEEFQQNFEESIVPALKKMYGEGSIVRVEFNEEKKQIKVFASKKVVEEVEDWDTEISESEAKDIDEKYVVGDVVETQLNLKEFGRVAAITIKQMMTQKSREKARNQALEEINARQNQIVTAKIKKMDRDNFILEIPGSTLEGVLGGRGQIPGQVHKIGDFIKVFINPVIDDRRGEIMTTRTSPQFIKALFDLEVPEIARGEVEVKSIAREAGYRTKICVAATVPNVDPVGACVGNKGSRIQNILAELGGEKVDLIPYSEDHLEFIASSLSPAPVLKVDESTSEEKRVRVVVPNDKLSLAIGKSGMNVRLAAKLTGWKIDVLSEDKAAAQDAEFSEDVVLGGE